jgi:hypothetical protein
MALMDTRNAQQTSMGALFGQTKQTAAHTRNATMENALARAVWKQDMEVRAIFQLTQHASSTILTHVKSFQ